MPFKNLVRSSIPITRTFAAVSGTSFLADVPLGYSYTAEKTILPSCWGHHQTSAGALFKSLTREAPQLARAIADSVGDMT